MHSARHVFSYIRTHHDNITDRKLAFLSSARGTTRSRFFHDSVLSFAEDERDEDKVDSFLLDHNVDRLLKQQSCGRWLQQYIVNGERRCGVQRFFFWIAWAKNTFIDEAEPA
jgi:hypothetical protein